MKKNLLIKLISLMLAVSVLCLPLAGVMAQAAQQQGLIVQDCPNIDIHGVMASTIYVDVNDPSKGRVFEYSADDILGAVKQALPALGKFAVTYNYEALGDSLVPIVRDLFGTSILLPNGEAPENCAVVMSYPDADSITKDSDLSFRYDWRLDPLDSAQKLNDFIEYVCAASGCEQVTLKCHSFGGVVTMSYLAQYGNKRIKAVCLNTTAINGQNYMNELFTGKVVFDAQAIQDYLKFALDDTEYEYFLNSLIKMLKDAGLLNVLSKFANKLVEELAAQLYPEIYPVFAGWPSLWDMVPDEALQDCKNYVFNECLAGNGNDYSGLIQKIDNYTALVREHKDEILNSLDENADVYVISRFGYASVPVTVNASEYGDGVIETSSSSFGATTAPYGKTLSEEYLSTVNAEYVSPDKTVDASTCRFPERTWFIRNLKHANNTDALNKMILTLLYSPEKATVDTYEQYPRYLLNTSDEELVPYTAPQAEPTFFERIKLIFAEIKALFKTLYASVSSK